MSETPRPDPWAQVSEYLIGSGRYHRVDQVDAARAADAAERDRAIAEVCAFSREQGIEAARAELEANALIAQLQAERDTLRAELDAARTTVQNLTRERDDAYVKLAEYVFPPGLADEQLAHEATKQQHAERTVERDAAQQQIATLTQELSVSRANHIDANQRNMQSVRELEAAEARCATLQWAVAADEERLRQAAARAGVLFVGCDTADALADRCATLTAAMEQLRDCDWTIGRGDRMDPVRDIARAALSGVPTP